MIYRPERDTDPQYLLGPFDAKRMIRLEGAPSKYAASCAASFVDVQRRFPTVDRNITYLTWSVQLKADGSPGLRAGASNRSQLYWDEVYYPQHEEEAALVTVSGEQMSLTADAQIAFIEQQASEERIDFAKFPAAARRLQYARARVGFSPHQFRSSDAYFSTYWARAGAHEHGHTLWSELSLSDWYLGTSLKDEVLSAIREVVPGYDEAVHQDAVGALEPHRSCLTWLAAPVVAEICAHGIPRHGWKNTHELIAEAFAMYAKGYSTPLIDAIGSTLERVMGRSSALRVERQQQLLHNLYETIPVVRNPLSS